MNATPEMATIPISTITLDPELQPRAVMDADLVAEYVDAMEGGAEFPPVVVFRAAATVFLADGFHRVAACQHLGKAEVTAVVHDGTREQALRYALAANAAHGARRSPGDLIRAYDTAVRNGLVDPGDTKAVQDMIRCSPRWAAELTQLVRTEAKDKRDAEVARKVREGKSQREIAEEMGIPRATVQRAARKSTVPFASTVPPAVPTGTDSAPHGLVLHAEAKRVMAACLAECYADGPAHVVLGLFEKGGVARRRSTEESNAVMAAVTAWKFGDSMEPVAALGYLAKDHSMLMMIHQIYAHFNKKGWLAYLADGEKWRKSQGFTDGPRGRGSTSIDALTQDEAAGRPTKAGKISGLSQAEATP